VRDALIAALPPGRSLQFRQPADLQRWYPTPADASTTGAQARIGLHNDCFLADDTDVGTYPDGEPQRSYIRQLTRSPPSAARPARRPTRPGPATAAPTSCARGPNTT